MMAGLSGWLATPAGRWVIRLARWAFVVAVMAFLVREVGRIGWSEVWRALPRTPWFYLLFLAMYLALPMSETLIYRLIWPGQARAGLGVFVRKRVLNSAAIGYSGEAWLLLWARDHIGWPTRRIVASIKDVSILSAVASTLATLVLLALWLATGHAGPMASVDAALRQWLGAGLAVVALVFGGLLMFRRTLFWVEQKVALMVLAIHVARISIVLVMQVVQWLVAVPAVGVATWITYVTVQMLVSRLPLLPNRDLIFLSVGLAISRSGGDHQAAIAAVLLASGALTQLANLTAMIVTGFTRVRPPPGIAS